MINTARHREVFNPLMHKHPIHIIGAGATGSRLFASLVELGFEDITVYDDDKVENHNLANQLFIMDDIDKLKVEGLDRWVHQKLGEGLKHGLYIPERLPHAEYDLEGTVFLLTDTMSSRREIYDHCLKDNILVERVIETRMASSFGNIYSFDPAKTGDQWLNTLISDDEAEVSSCGSSISVGATASIIANQAVWQFMLSLTDPEGADDIVDVYLQPFCMSTRSWEY